ncbi:hypothetical protein JCM14469_19860 [Desulfatiferula olefinivorans]
MKALTIRGVEPEVSEKLKIIAAKQGKSVNQLMLEFIKKNLGLEKEKQYSREYHDLDDLFGTWSDDEYENIQGRINGERQIDQELWD